MSQWLNGRIDIITGDITKLQVDVIVNAANAALSGGGGVDGAIHKAAGPKLLEECRTLGGARPGEVKMTRGYELPAKFVAHAVGPVWQDGDHREPELLALCYSRTLELVDNLGFETVAFPSISTGAYRFPLLKAARIALSTVRDHLLRNSQIVCVTFCCFTANDTKHYEKVSAELLGGSGTSIKI